MKRGLTDQFVITVRAVFPQISLIVMTYLKVMIKTNNPTVTANQTESWVNQNPVYKFSPHI
jgi:hypothetical protein